MKSQNLKYIAVYLLISVLSGISAVCTVSNTVPWDVADYDSKASDISDTTARPLGFKVGKIGWEPPTSLCVTVNGTNGKHVQILTEAIPSNYMCVKQLRNGEDEHLVCGNEKIGQCPLISTDGGGGEALFEFYCSSQCTEGDIDFWYRFVVAGPEDNEYWCDNNAVDEYPSELVTLPVGFLSTRQPSTTPNKASLPTVYCITTLITSLLYVDFTLLQ